jgi:hypothetical protein
MCRAIIDDFSFKCVRVLSIYVLFSSASIRTVHRQAEIALWCGLRPKGFVLVYESFI